VAYSIVLLPMRKVFECNWGKPNPNPNPNGNRIQCKLLFSLPYCVHSFDLFSRPARIYLFTLLFYLLRFSVCFFLCPALKVQLNVDPVLVRFFAFLLPLTNKYIYCIYGSAMINGKMNEVNCQGRELGSYLQSMELQSSFHSIIPFIRSIILCFCDFQLLII